MNLNCVLHQHFVFEVFGVNLHYGQYASGGEAGGVSMRKAMLVILVQVLRVCSLPRG
jgi:hypothetical protein